METLNQILTNSTSKTKDNIESSLENSNEPQEYRENLSEKTEISYQQKSSVGDIIIEHTMEKNTAVQEFHEFATEYMPTRNSYGRQKEQYEYNLYKIIDTSFDRYTADEIKQRNNLFQRFQNKINENNPSFNDEMISSLFDEDEAKQQKEGKYDLEK
jgi:mevalonate kinase